MEKNKVTILLGILLVFGAIFSVFPIFPQGNLYRENYYLAFAVGCFALAIINMNPIFLLPIALGCGVYDTLLYVWRPIDVFWNIQVLGLVLILIYWNRGEHK